MRSSRFFAGFLTFGAAAAAGGACVVAAAAGRRPEGFTSSLARCSGGAPTSLLLPPSMGKEARVDSWTTLGGDAAPLGDLGDLGDLDNGGVVGSKLGEDDSRAEGRGELTRRSSLSRLL